MGDYSQGSPLFARCSLTLGCNVIGHFLDVCMTRSASGHSCILYSLGKLANSSESIREFSHQVISGHLMHLDFDVLAGGWFC